MATRKTGHQSYAEIVEQTAVQAENPVVEIDPVTQFMQQRTCTDHLLAAQKNIRAAMEGVSGDDLTSLRALNNTVNDYVVRLLMREHFDFVKVFDTEE